MTTFARFDCGYYHEDPLGNVSLHCDDPSQHAQFNPAADPAPRWGRCPNCGVEHTGDDCMEGKHRHVPDPYMLAGIESAPTPTPPPTTKRPGNYPTGPRLTHGATQSQIRDWARAQGLDVNPRGIVRRDIADAYAAAHQETS